MYQIHNEKPFESSVWIHRFLELSETIAQWSKDPSTKVGAVITDVNNRIVSTGYNGFPKNFNDSRMDVREYKLPRVIHAELNAILYAKNDLANTTLFVSHPCCSGCASTLVAAGIRRVVWRDNPEFEVRWNSNIAREILIEAGVELVIIDSNKNIKHHFNNRRTKYDYFCDAF